MKVQLSIVTPTEDVLKIECDEVVAPGVAGELGFLPGHLPLITALKPGVLTVTQGSRRRFFAVGSGFAEVEHNHVSVLTESCEEGSAVHRERAEAAQRGAEAKLAAMSPDDPGFLEQQRRAARARARIDAAARRS